MKILRAFGWFLAFGIATYLVVLFGTLLAWDLLGIADHDVGGAMGLAFVIAPVLAIMGGLVGSNRQMRRQTVGRSGSGRQ